MQIYPEGLLILYSILIPYPFTSLFFLLLVFISDLVKQNYKYTKYTQDESLFVSHFNITFLHQLPLNFQKQFLWFENLHLCQGQFLELWKVVTLIQSENEMAQSSLGRYRRVGVLFHFCTRSLFLGGNP